MLTNVPLLKKPFSVFHCSDYYSCSAIMEHTLPFFFCLFGNEISGFSCRWWEEQGATDYNPSKRIFTVSVISLSSNGPAVVTASAVTGIIISRLPWVLAVWDVSQNISTPGCTREVSRHVLWRCVHRIKAASKDFPALQGLAVFLKSLEMFVSGALTVSGNKWQLWKSLGFCSQRSATGKEKVDEGCKKHWECSESS